MSNKAALSVSQPAKEPVRRGFPGLKCLCCGEEDTVRVSLEEVTLFSCSGCDAELSVEDVRETVATWQRVIVWIETAPAINE